MIIIGELLNTSRREIAAAVESRDADVIQKIAKAQEEAGAHYIDVNAGTRVHDEPEALSWLVETVQKVVSVPLCIDSPNPLALRAALKVHRGQALINSISAERERYGEILPLVQEHKARIMALCMDDNGMPTTVNERLKVVDFLYRNLTEAGINPEDIFFDPLAKPISVNTEFGNDLLEAIRTIHRDYPGVHTTCGLSNVSFGLPNRKLLNQAFLITCMANGMDSAILDPLDKNLMGLLIATKALLGNDEYCMDYITTQRNS